MATGNATPSSRAPLLAPAGVVLILLLLVPIAILLSYSLAPGGTMQADFSDGLTLENYQSVLGDSFYLGIMAKTIGLSLVVTVISILLGWPLAYFLWRASPRWKALLTLAVVAPLLISIPVRNYGWMVILGDNGLINVTLRSMGIISAPIRMMFTDLATIIGLTHVLMPFVVLSVLAALERVPAGLADAAQTLGATRLRAIVEVLLPLSVPGILGGGVLVFCVAVSAYVTPALMGPSGAKYSATLLYQQFVSVFDWPRGAAIAGVLLIITLVALLTVLGLVNRRYGRLLRES